MILTITIHDPNHLEFRLESAADGAGPIALLPSRTPAPASHGRLRRLAGAGLRWTGAATLLGAVAGMALLMMPAGHRGLGVAALGAAGWAHAAPTEAPGEMPLDMRAALAAPPQVSPPPAAPGTPTPSSEDPLKAFGLER